MNTIKLQSIRDTLKLEGSGEDEFHKSVVLLMQDILDALLEETKVGETMEDLKAENKISWREGYAAGREDALGGKPDRFMVG